MTHEVAVPWLFQQQYAGRHVVLFAKVPSRPEQLIAEADEFVQRTSSLLQREPPAPVYWLRDSVPWASTRYLRGWAIVHELPVSARTESAGLSYDDRRALARGFIALFEPAGAHPPALIREGFVDYALYGGPSQHLLTRSWNALQDLGDVSVAELAAGDWYDSQRYPVGAVGAALVAYLLEQSGPGSLIELLGCRSAAEFSEKCERILGYRLRELDDPLESYLRERVGEPSDVTEWLDEIEIADNLDTRLWQQFRSAHDRRVALFSRRNHYLTLAGWYWRRGSEAIEPSSDNDDDVDDDKRLSPGEHSETPLQTLVAWLQGPRMAVQLLDEDTQQTWVAAPELSFFADRRGPDRRLIRISGGSDQTAYRNIQSACRFQLATIRRAISPWLVDFPASGRRYGPWRLTALEQLDPSTHMRLRFDRPQSPIGFPTRILVEGSSNDGRVTRVALESLNAADERFFYECRIEYTKDASAFPVPARILEQGLNADGRVAYWVDLEARHWDAAGQISKEQFAPASFDLTDVSLTASDGESNWTGWAASLAFGWPAIGLLLLLVARQRSSPGPAAS